MAPSTQLLAVVGILAAAHIIQRLISEGNSTLARDDFRAQLAEQRQFVERMLDRQTETFKDAVGAVSDATAKAVQSITYPETLSDGALPANGQLPMTREMPVLERDRTVDYSDPTDATMPDEPAHDEWVGLEVGSGIPGLMVDPTRYDVI